MSLLSWTHSSGLLQRTSMLINLCALAYPRAPFSSYYILSSLFHSMSSCWTDQMPPIISMQMILVQFFSTCSPLLLPLSAGKKRKGKKIASIMLVADSSCSPLPNTWGYPLSLNCPRTLHQIDVLSERALPYALLCHFLRGNLIQRW